MAKCEILIFLSVFISFFFAPKFCRLKVLKFKFCQMNSDVHRARHYCFGLLDLIRYFQYPGENLSTQVVETTP